MTFATKFIIVVFSIVMVGALSLEFNRINKKLDDIKIKLSIMEARFK